MWIKFISSSFFSSSYASIWSLFFFSVFSLFSIEISSYSFFSISFRIFICSSRILSLLFFSCFSFSMVLNNTSLSFSYFILSRFSLTSNSLLILFLIFLIFYSSLLFLSLYFWSWSLNLSTFWLFSYILDSYSFLWLYFPTADNSNFFYNNSLYFYNFISLDSASLKSFPTGSFFFLLAPGSKTISIVCLVLTISRFFYPKCLGDNSMEREWLRSWTFFLFFS